MSDAGQVTLVYEPTIIVLAEMGLLWEGVTKMADWVEMYRPEAMEGLDPDQPMSLLPHNGHDGLRKLTSNEMLVELSGRKCYNSFGLKAGRKSNSTYIANLFGDPRSKKLPHASVLYHAKMSFFFGGLSRRVSHELIRHYVGADRTEEGSPSQESTRYTHHPGHFTVHPRLVESEVKTERFRQTMQQAYDAYQGYLNSEMDDFEDEHGTKPKGIDRKRIYEAAAQLLPGAAATSFVWTTNPMALDKLFKERCDFAADLEIERFAKKLRRICYQRWPNLFPQSNPAVEWAEEE